GNDTDVIRFTSTASGDTLTLSTHISNVEEVRISDASGATTGTTALNINASNVGYGITLTGNDGANTLAGGAGNDLLTGHGGAASRSGAAATDPVNYAAETGGGAIPVNFPTATFGLLNPGQATDTGGATDPLSGIQNVTAGSGYDDTVAIVGNASDWTITFD